MKTCPVCKITFHGYALKVYCSDRCARKAKYQRTETKQNSFISQVLLTQLKGYGIREKQIPQKADAEFLADILFALRVTTKK